MTVQQAQAEINKCEQEIAFAHSSLCIAARTVGSSAKECADGSKTKKTLLTVVWHSMGRDEYGHFLAEQRATDELYAVMTRRKTRNVLTSDFGNTLGIYGIHIDKRTMDERC